jgi:2-hydroxychromene-2-carboxylate isomerase
MRCAAAAQKEGKGWEFCLALFHSYWGEGQDVSEMEILTKLVNQVGLKAEPFFELATSQENKDHLRGNVEEAVERQVFGAPAIFVGNEHFWGNDRLDFAVRAMKA